MTTATKPFTPSSTLLLHMIASAEAKFEAAREQAALRKEAREAEQAARWMAAEVAARSRAWWRS
jgi:hypothetical protein